MGIVFEAALRWAVPAVCVATTAWAAAQIKRGRERDMALQMGVRALLRDRLYQAHDYYMEQGYYPIHARENVEAMYTQYKALGGNGTVTNLVHELDSLPTSPKGE